MKCPKTLTKFIFHTSNDALSTPQWFHVLWNVRTWWIVIIVEWKVIISNSEHCGVKSDHFQPSLNVDWPVRLDKWLICYWGKPSYSAASVSQVTNFHVGKLTFPCFICFEEKDPNTCHVHSVRFLSQNKPNVIARSYYVTITWLVYVCSLLPANHFI